MDVAIVRASPPPRRKRRLLRAIGWIAGTPVVLWLVAFAVTTWQKDEATQALRARGMPSTYEEVVARMHATVGPQTGTGLLRKAIIENERIGRPGDRYVLTYAKFDLDADDVQQAFLADAVRRGETVRRLLEEARALPPGPFTRPDAVAESSVGRTEEEIHQIRSLARLVWPLLKSALRRGDHDDAVRLLSLSFRLSEALAAEQFLLPQLVRIAILGVANAYTLAALPHVTLNEQRFKALDERLASVERELKFEATLFNERAAAASVFETPAALKERMQSAAAVPASLGWVRPLSVVAERGWVELLCSPIGLPPRRRGAAQCLSTPDDVLALVDRPPPWPAEAQELYDRWKTALNNERLMLTVINTSSIDVLWNAGLYARRRIAMARLALRLKWFDQRFGRLPDRLDEVCDAAMPELPLTWFEGKPFVYTKSGRSLRVEADPSVAEQKDANLLSREDIRVAWGLLVKLDFSPPPPVKRP